MKILNLNANGISEMNLQELIETDGGAIEITIKTIIVIILNPGTVWA